MGRDGKQYVAITAGGGGGYFASPSTSDSVIAFFAAVNQRTFKTGGRQMSRDTLTPSELSCTCAACCLRVSPAWRSSVCCTALRRYLNFAASPASPIFGFRSGDAGFRFKGDPAKVGKRSSRADQAPRPFRTYSGVEYENFEIPPDAGEKTEWMFARLMYRGIRYANWTIDYPRSDRHLIGRRATSHAGAGALRGAACCS